MPKVDAEALAAPGPTKLEGTAQAVDGDEIRVGDSLVRLYGIAAPDMSARLGPEARITLEDLVGGRRVNCQIFDKTPSGDALGQCTTADGDPAEIMLSRGLAALYRNGNANDGIQQALATKYDAAEVLARKQAVGLWAPPAPPVDPQIAERERLKWRVIGFSGFALLIIAIFTISITRLSIARRDRIERARLREETRTTLSFAMAAEVEIVLATTRKLIEQVSGQPADRPLPSAISATLALPSTPFWDANAERLHLLPVDVTVHLLRFHALYEDAARKLAVASAVPSGLLAGTLNALAEIGKAAVTAIEASLGIERAPEPAPKPKDAPPPPPSPEKASSEKPSTELNNPPRKATN